MVFFDYRNPSLPSTTGAGLNENLHVLPEAREKPYQTLAREPREATIQKSGHPRLIDAQDRPSGSLCQATQSDEFANPARKLRLGQLFVGLPDTDIGEDVSRAGRYSDAWFLRHSS